MFIVTSIFISIILKMNILITGANGQLGNEMRVLSRENLRHTCFFTDAQELDVCDAHAVRSFVADNRVDIIVNCAAYTSVDKAEDDPELCDRLNHLAPGYLASAAEASGAALIQVSTDYVFDGTSCVPYTEEVAPCPDSVYGSTKLAGERVVMENCSRSMIIRTGWLYSGYGNNFVKTMLRLGRERETLGVVFDQIGTPTYANDLARAIFAVIDRGILSGIYHFSDEGVCSWYDFALAIHRLAGITACKVRPLHTDEFPSKATRPHYSVLDKTKIKKAFGIEIPHWEKSLEACLSNPLLYNYQLK